MSDISSAVAAAGLLFVMEFADKTQLAVMSLTARTGRMIPIFMGAAAALVLLTLLAAAIGGALSRLLPDRWLSLAAGLSFLGAGIFLLWRAIATRERPDDGAAASEADKLRQPVWRHFALAFGLVFVAELGDKSQLTVIGLVADTGDWLPVFAGAAFGLTAMTLVGAVAGSTLQRLVPRPVMRFAPGAVFVVVGLLSLAGII